MKMELAESHGVTLIPIPFWWDGRENRYYAIFSSSFYLSHMQFKIYLTLSS